MGGAMEVIGRTLKLKEAIIFAELDGEAVLLDIDTGIYYGLDQVGTEIWGLLQQGKNEDEIVRQLNEEYDVDLAQLRPDVVSFLAELQDHGLALSGQGAILVDSR
jgi:hypothetical protein